MSVVTKILFFAGAKDRVGQDEMIIQLNSFWPDKHSLLNHLCHNIGYNLSDIITTMTLAINEEYIINDNDSINLNENDVIALIPPITGG